MVGLASLTAASKKHPLTRSSLNDNTNHLILTMMYACGCVLSRVRSCVCVRVCVCLCVFECVKMRVRKRIIRRDVIPEIQVLEHIETIGLSCHHS